MKVLRIVTITVFVLMLAGYGIFSWNEQNSKDMSLPVITADSSKMDVSIRVTYPELLKGVTAYDEKDGDLTDKILVESLSKFIDDSTFKVTYAVCDADSHVAKFERTVKYVDYTPPRFTLERPLLFTPSEKTDVRTMVGAWDCIEGDISEKITILSSNFIKNREGSYTLYVQAANKQGDKIRGEFPIYVEEENKLAPKVTLKENIIYLKKDSAPPAWKTYIDTVKRNDQLVPNVKVTVSGNVDTRVPGLYEIHYRVTDETGLNPGHAVLIVIVEE